MATSKTQVFPSCGDGRRGLADARCWGRDASPRHPRRLRGNLSPYSAAGSETQPYPLRREADLAVMAVSAGCGGAQDTSSHAFDSGRFHASVQL